MKRRAGRPLRGRQDRVVAQQLARLQDELEAELDRAVEDVLRQLRDRETRR